MSDKRVATVVVDDCLICPNCKDRFDFKFYRCSITRKDVRDTGIPDWCPLPKAKEE